MKEMIYYTGLKWIKYEEDDEIEDGTYLCLCMNYQRPYYELCQYDHDDGFEKHSDVWFEPVIGVIAYAKLDDTCYLHDLFMKPE